MHIDPSLQLTQLEERSLYLFAFGYPQDDGIAKSVWLLAYAPTPTTMLTCYLYQLSNGSWEKKMKLDDTPAWSHISNQPNANWLLYRIVGSDNTIMSEDVLRHAAQVVQPRLDTSLTIDWIPKMFLFDIVMWLRDNSMLVVDDPGRWWKEIQDCVQRALARKTAGIHEPLLLRGTLSR